MANAQTWLDRLLTKLISVAGIQQPNRGTLDFAAGFTTTDDPTNDTIHITAVGTAALPGQTNLTLANGANQNVDPGGKTVLRITGPTAPFSIGGFVAPAAPVTLHVVNASGQPMTFNDEDVGSTGANRIKCQSAGAPATTIPTTRVCQLTYDTLASRWTLQSLGILRPTHFNVQDFGAKGDGSNDDTAAIQAAIDAVAWNIAGKVFFPQGTYKITSTILVGRSGALNPNGRRGIVIEGESNINSASLASLQWAGAAGGIMMILRNSDFATIKGLSFNGNITQANGNTVSADICLQTLHTTSDVDVLHGCIVEHCFFSEFKKYGVLIGDLDGVTYNGDVSNCTFLNCRWVRSFFGAQATACVKHRSSNSINNRFINCELDATAGYPIYGMIVESGVVQVEGGFSQNDNHLTGGADFFLPTPPDATVPGGLLLDSWASQSSNLLQVDPPNIGANSQYPITLVNVQHSDTFADGDFSVKWNRSGFATLTIVGGSFNTSIDIVGTQPNVFLMGVMLVGASITGHAEIVRGRWAAGGLAVEAGSPWLLTPEQFGADPTFSVVSDTAFAALFAAKDTLGGAVIALKPDAHYAISTAIDLGSSPFIMRGGGWQMRFRSGYGTPPTVTGTRIECQGAGRLKISADAMGASELSDFALIGPGSGSTTGLSVVSPGPSGSVNLRATNLLITQFFHGLDVTLWSDCVWRDVQCVGNSVGADFQNANVHRFENCTFANNTGDGLLIETCNTIDIDGGTFTANGASALHLAPRTGAQLIQITIERANFSSNTTAGINVDTTTAYIDGVHISACKGDANGFVFTTPGGVAVYNLTVEDDNRFAQGWAQPLAPLYYADISSAAFLPEVAAITTQQRQHVGYEAVGATNGVGSTIVLTVPIPTNTNCRLTVNVLGYVTTAGGTAGVGDSFASEQIVFAKNVAGVVTLYGVQPAAQQSADASQGADTVTAAAAGATVTITATQVGGTNTGTITWRLWAELEVE